MIEEFWPKLEAALESNDADSINQAMEVLHWIADLCAFGGDPNTLDEFVPLREDLLDLPYNESTAEKAKSLLRRFIEAGPEDHRSSAVGILGDFRDSSDVPLFRDLMETGLTQVLAGNRLLHQATISLDNIEEFRGDGCYSMADLEDNVSRARNYLAQFGKSFPW